MRYLHVTKGVGNKVSYKPVNLVVTILKLFCLPFARFVARAGKKRGDIRAATQRTKGELAVTK